MNKHKEVKISLVGAGPGDPELITVKGLKALQSADAILYDALVHPDLLKEAPSTAVLLPVGKRYKGKRTPQETINRLLVSTAFKYGKVVRLKGGDPMVFARGMEEMTYAQHFGIEVELIPGLSSSTALATSAGIPLTHRNLSRSFWVVTATGSDGNLTEDFRLAAQSSATLVVLMGLHKAAEIAQHFRALGKGDVPVAIIQSGTREEEQRLYTTTGSMAEDLRERPMKAPALILMGSSVAVAEEYAATYGLLDTQMAG